MEKAEDLLQSADACERRLRSSASAATALGPTVLQLGGDDPILLAKAAQRARAGDYGFTELNLNCGCPSIETGGAHYGAALMLDPLKTRHLVAAMADAWGAPVSVKCRIGVHARTLHSDDGAMLLPDDHYEALLDFATAAIADGHVSHLAVHARAAVLAGLNPARNRQAPPLRPNLVHRLAADLPAIRVTLNGGVSGLAAVRALASEPSELPRRGESGGVGEIEGVMAGRWLLRRPLDLGDVDSEAAIAVAIAARGGGAAAAPTGGLMRGGALAEAVRTYGAYAARQV